MSQQHRRTTRQRTAVADLLRSSTEFRSAQDIHAALRDAGDKVGLATVYLLWRRPVTPWLSSQGAARAARRTR